MPQLAPFAMCLLILALPAVALQDTSNTNEKKASVEGTVRDAVSGKFLKGVNVVITEVTAARSRSSATTDDAGHYFVKDLKAGKYVLTAKHPNYTPRMYGLGGKLMNSIPLSLAAGQALKETDVRLQPHAVISGKVLDEDGEPLEDVMVTLLQPIHGCGGLRYTSRLSESTNDLGEFRIEDVIEGTYLVVTDLSEDEENASFVYLPTFYPNSTEVGGAAPIVARAGTETSGIDIRLVRTKAVRVTGKVRGGAAGRELRVLVLPKKAGVVEMRWARRGRVNPANGSFEIAAVPPGSGILRVWDAAAGRFAGTDMPLEVGDKPINDVTIDATLPPDLSGEIVFDGEASQKPSLKARRASLSPADEMAMSYMVDVAADGQFQMKAVSPGKYSVGLRPVPEGTYISEVTFGGQRTSDDGLEILPGGAAKLEIKLRPGAAQVEGTVQDAEGRAVPGAKVVLIPKSRRCRLFNAAMTDQNGVFNLRNITPDDYVLLAMDEMELGIEFDPEFLKRYESKGEKITLKENDRKGVTLKLVPKD